MMPHIPEEVISLIVSNYETTYHQQADNASQGVYLGKEFFTPLKNLCLVSKAFKRVCQSLLYHTYVYDTYIWQDNVPPNGRRTPRHGTMKLFLRTLLENPDIARMVKHVSLENWEIVGGDRPSDLPWEPASETQAALYDTAWSDMGIELPVIQDYLKKGHGDAEVALLLAICPNIETLHMEVPRGFDVGSHVMRLFHAQWGQKSGSPPTERMLGKLEALLIRHYDTENTIGLYEIRAWLHLPQLTSLYGHMVSDGGPESDDCPDGFSPRLLCFPPLKGCTLKHINLMNSLWDPDGMIMLLKGCHQLESFKMSLGDACVGECSSDFASLGQAFRKYGKSLKSIMIDQRDSFNYSELDEDDEDEFGGFRQMGSLKSLKQLRFLQAPLDLLVDKDEDMEFHEITDEEIVALREQLRDEVLASTIEEVVVIGDYEDHELHFEGLEEYSLYRLEKRKDEYGY